MTKAAFINAIKVHQAISGSTNATIHFPAIAHQLGIDIHPRMFDEIGKNIKYLTNVQPSGKYITEFLWYAGGIPMIQMYLKDELDLNVMTVTGRTLGENLEMIERATSLNAALAISRPMALIRKISSANRNIRINTVLWLYWTAILLLMAVSLNSRLSRIPI